MRFSVNIKIFLLFLTAAAFCSLHGAKPAGRVYWDAEKRNITLRGHNTPESVAAALKDKTIFEYDAQKRRSICRARLTIRGKMRLTKETLEIQMPGREGFIGIARGGALILKNATLKAFNNGKYDIQSSGLIEAVDSKILDYDANSSRSFRLEKNSVTTLKNCRMRGRYIYIVSPEIKISVSNCDFAGCPLSFRLRKDVLVSLLDCRNVSNPVLERGARLVFCSNVPVQLQKENGKPLAGVKITASSSSRSGKTMVHAPAATDKKGRTAIPMAVLDFDGDGSNNFYRTQLTAEYGSKKYVLGKDLQKTDAPLIFRQKGETFEAISRSGKKVLTSGKLPAGKLPAGLVQGKNQKTIGTKALFLTADRENGNITSLKGKYWKSAGKTALVLRDENNQDVTGKVSGLRETPQTLSLFRPAPGTLIEEKFSSGKACLEYTVKVTNQSPHRLYRTVYFSIPVDKGTELAYWNGLQEVQYTPGKKYGDSVMTGRFPMSCLYSKNSGIALGIAGEQFFSHLESGGTPGKNFYYAVKMVIDPGKTEKAVFLLYDFKPDFRYLNALQRYYDMFPQFFSPADGVPQKIYGIGGKVRTPSDATYREKSRRLNMGWDWIYAPFQRTGYWYPEKNEWNRKAGRDSSFPPSKEVRYYELSDYRQAIIRRQEAAKNACIAAHYIIPRSSDTELADKIFPDSILHTITGTTVPAAGVFADRRGICMYAAGNKFGERTLSDIEKIVKNFNVSGFAFDEAWGTEFCFGGKGVENSPGRAFMENALYALTAVPYALCMDKAHSLKTKSGDRPAVVANMPQIYMCAFRSDAVLFENPWYRGTRVLRQIRRLTGRKPISMWEGYPIVYDKKTPPEKLRKQLQDTVRDLILFSLSTGITPGTMHTTGFPEAAKAVPAILELTRAGWEPVPAIHAPAPLECARFGKDLNTRLALVNRSAKDFSGELILDNRYVGKGTYFFTPVFDKAGIRVLEKSRLVSCRLTPGKTALKVTIPARSALLLRAAGSLDLSAGYTDPSVKGTPALQQISLDGTAEIRNIRLAFDGSKRFSDKIEVNGKAVSFSGKDKSLLLKENIRAKRLEIRLHSSPRIRVENIDRILAFEFVRNGKPACVITVPDAAAPAELDAAEQLTGYFSYYYRQTTKKNLLLPIRRKKQTAKRHIQIVIDSSRKEKGCDGFIRPDGKGLLIGGNVGEAMKELLPLLDKRYPYYGECTDPVFKQLKNCGLLKGSLFE